MKRVGLFIALIFSVTLSMYADNEVRIEKRDLPYQIRKMLDKNYGGHSISYIEKDQTMSRTEYEVVFFNGDKIEFGNDEEWTEIEAKQGAVPHKLIPSKTRSYLKKNYPNQQVKKIEKDRSGYEVKLANGLELEFDTNGKFLRID